MVGTEDGYWYSFKQRKDGLLDYSFYQYNNHLQDGVGDEEDMILWFWDLVKYSRINEIQSN